MQIHPPRSSNGEMLIRDAKKLQPQVIYDICDRYSYDNCYSQQDHVSFDNNVITWNTFEPSTLRTLISFCVFLLYMLPYQEVQDMR